MRPPDHISRDLDVIQQWAEGHGLYVEAPDDQRRVYVAAVTHEARIAIDQLAAERDHYRAVLIGTRRIVPAHADITYAEGSS